MAQNDDECEPLFATRDRQIYCASNPCYTSGFGSSVEGLRFYRFPLDVERCRQWIKNCGNRALCEKPVAEVHQNNYLCGAHFDASQFEKGGSHRLVSDAVPTLVTSVNLQRLEIDHDYSVPAYSENQSPSTKLPSFLKVASQGITVVEREPKEASQASPAKLSTVSDTSKRYTSNNCPQSCDTSEATVIEQQPTSLTVSKPRVVVEVPQKGLPAASQRQSQIIRTKKPPLLARRFTASAKETPLQKYMLLCADFKSQLKSLEKRKEKLEKLFGGVQELLFQEAELLNMEDAALLVGALVQFLQERYRREPDGRAEMMMLSLWQRHQSIQPHPAHQRPFAQVAVFVMDKSRPGRVVLGKRKSILGGGLYQVPCGEIEFGETWDEAASREVFESTAMHISDLSVCSVVDTVEWTAGYHAVTVFVRGTVDASQEAEPEAMQPDLCDSWHWRTWQELPALKELHWPLRDYKAEGLTPFP